MTWTRHKVEGIKMQEIVAIQLEKHFPFPKYTIISNDSHGIDVEVIDNDLVDIILSIEVKSAFEYYYHCRERKNRKRRGTFVISESDLRADIYVFAIRFTDIPGKWNGEYEIWYVSKNCFESFIKPKIKKYNPKSHNSDGWEGCHLRIHELQQINATLNVNEVLKNYK